MSATLPITAPDGPLKRDRIGVEIIELWPRRNVK
jgi:hypothetical protein